MQKTWKPKSSGVRSTRKGVFLVKDEKESDIILDSLGKIETLDLLNLSQNSLIFRALVRGCEIHVDETLFQEEFDIPHPGIRDGVGESPGSGNFYLEGSGSCVRVFLKKVGTCSRVQHSFMYDGLSHGFGDGLGGGETVYGRG